MGDVIVVALRPLAKIPELAMTQKSSFSIKYDPIADMTVELKRIMTIQAA